MIQSPARTNVKRSLVLTVQIRPSKIYRHQNYGLEPLVSSSYLQAVHQVATLKMFTVIPSRVIERPSAFVQLHLFAYLQQAFQSLAVVHQS